MSLAPSHTVLEQAERCADLAALSAGVSVFVLDDLDDLARANRLFADVWNVNGFEPVMTSPILKAMSHSGNYVSGAFRNGELVGASAGFFARHNGEPSLHSHVTGVSPLAQGRSVGFALKQHQRSWALAQDIDAIYWTFDPLVRRNAFFNVTKLGAEIISFHEQFYGEMSDGINAGDESDRCLIKWSLASPKAVAAAEGDHSQPSQAEMASANVILRAGDRDEPIIGMPDGRVLTAEIPADIVQLRTADPSLGAAWREALRRSLGGALATGYVVTGMTRSGRYVLQHHD